jgi:acetyl-CoA C-acetyltransferase
MPMLQTADASRSTTRSRAKRKTSTRCRASSAPRPRKPPGFDAEIVPLPSWKYVERQRRRSFAKCTVTLAKDEGNRADTTLEGLAALKGVLESELADHRRQLIAALRRRGRGRRHGREARREAQHQPLGIYRGLVVVGCEPGEMGIGPVFASPKLLKRHGLTVDDIDLWELNEAFAVQTVYCRDTLGIPTKSSTSTAARSRSATRTA